MEVEDLLINNQHQHPQQLQQQRRQPLTNSTVQFQNAAINQGTVFSNQKGVTGQRGALTFCFFSV
jgi:hypothetical protein